MGDKALWSIIILDKTLAKAEAKLNEKRDNSPLRTNPDMTRLSPTGHPATIKTMLFVINLLHVQNSQDRALTPGADINSLAPGRFEHNFRKVIFKLISVTGGWGISCKIALRRMRLDLTDDKSTLVQVMAGAWRHQAITWANVDPDLCRHMVSIGHSESRCWIAP